MPCGVGDGDRAALGDAEQREPLQAEGVDHRLEVAHPRVEGERVVVDVPVRQAAAALVVADQRVPLRTAPATSGARPGCPSRGRGGSASWRLHQRRPVAADGVGEPHAVGRVAEADPLGGQSRGRGAAAGGCARALRSAPARGRAPGDASSLGPMPELALQRLGQSRRTGGAPRRGRPRRSRSRISPTCASSSVGSSATSSSNRPAAPQQLAVAQLEPLPVVEGPVLVELVRQQVARVQLERPVRAGGPLLGERRRVQGPPGQPLEHARRRPPPRPCRGTAPRCPAPSATLSGQPDRPAQVVRRLVQPVARQRRGRRRARGRRSPARGARGGRAPARGTRRAGSGRGGQLAPANTARSCTRRPKPPSRFTRTADAACRPLESRIPPPLPLESHSRGISKRIGRDPRPVRLAAAAHHARNSQGLSETSPSGTRVRASHPRACVRQHMCSMGYLRAGSAGSPHWKHSRSSEAFDHDALREVLRAVKLFPVALRDERPKRLRY